MVIRGPFEQFRGSSEPTERQQNPATALIAGAAQAALSGSQPTFCDSRRGNAAAPNLSLNRTARRRASAPSARGQLAWFVERLLLAWLGRPLPTDLKDGYGSVSRIRSRAGGRCRPNNAPYRIRPAPRRCARANATQRRTLRRRDISAPVLGRAGEETSLLRYLPASYAHFVFHAASTRLANCPSFALCDPCSA